MEYNFLGKSGLKVSKISFGNWLNSDDPKNNEKMTKLVQKAWDLGINFYDTAEAYGFGEGEVQMGKAIQGLIDNNVKREEIVLSTKIWISDLKLAPNTFGLPRKHILEGLKNSLKRLNQSYVDIVFAHRFDHEIPLEETCRAFDWVINQGWAHYWGTSEWKAAQIFEAYMICEKYGLIKPIADQTQYNMLARDKLEVDYARLFDIYGMGTTVWSPLAGGILTGKYNDKIPEQSRFENFKENPFLKQTIEKFMSDKNKPEYMKMMQGLADTAKELGCTQAQLAMAWVIEYKNVSTAITSASSESQLEDTVKAVEVAKKLTPEILQKINGILNNTPIADVNPKAWFQPFPGRR